MTNDTDVATLKADMSTVQRDISQLTRKVDDLGADVKRVVAWVERREGADAALAKSEERRLKANEEKTAAAGLNYTAVMALTGICGTLFGALSIVVPYLFKVHLP